MDCFALLAMTVVKANWLFDIRIRLSSSALCALAREARTITVFRFATAALLPHRLPVRAITKMGAAAAER